MEKPPIPFKYTEDFGEFLRQHPGALKDFLDLEKEIRENVKFETVTERVYQKGEVTILPLYDYVERSNFYKEDSSRKYSSYMKVSLGDQDFFVKTVAGYAIGDNAQRSGGYKEFKSLEKAAEVIKDIEGVKIINMKLGYSGRDNRTYFVSEWMDLPTLDEIKDSYTKDHGTVNVPTDKRAAVIKRAEDLEDLFNEKDFSDLHFANMFYDEKTDTIYVFDVFYLEE